MISPFMSILLICSLPTAYAHDELAHLRHPAVTTTVGLSTPTAPYSPTGSKGDHQQDKCHIHVWEHRACGPSNYTASIQLWDAAGNQLLPPTDFQSINDRARGVWTSKLEHPLILTAEHKAQRIRGHARKRKQDHIQFKFGSESWKSTTFSMIKSAWCNQGDWDPVSKGFPGVCSMGHVSVVCVAGMIPIMC